MKKILKWVIENLDGVAYYIDGEVEKVVIKNRFEEELTFFSSCSKFVMNFTNEYERVWQTKVFDDPEYAVILIKRLLDGETHLTLIEVEDKANFQIDEWY